MTSIQLIKGNAHTCFNSTKIVWVNCYELIVDGVKTPVDYDNSGFTLHNDKLYVESLGDLMQFIYSIDTPRVVPLVEGKELPPEMMYLLTKEELGRWNNKWKYMYNQEEKGISWDTEWDDELKDIVFTILNQERIDELGQHWETLMS